MNDIEYTKYLTEIGYCSAAVGISPGYDIEKCMGRFGPPYANMLLEKGKKFFIKDNEDILKGCPGFHECLLADDLQAWLDSSYGMGGFESREEYYDKTNPMRFVHHIRQPVLMLNATDDPLCLIENVYNNEYMFEMDPPTCAITVVTETGSHCSFYEMGMYCWSEKVAFEFLDHALSNDV